MKCQSSGRNCISVGPWYRVHDHGSGALPSKGNSLQKCLSSSSNCRVLQSTETSDIGCFYCCRMSWTSKTQQTKLTVEFKVLQSRAVQLWSRLLMNVLGACRVRTWMAHSRRCLPDGQPGAEMFRLACLFHSLQSTFSLRQCKFSLRHLPASSKFLIIFFFQQVQSLSEKLLSWGARGSICHLFNVAELTATNANSQGHSCSSDLTERFFCHVKIVQKPCTRPYVCQRCFFQMLKAHTMRGLGGSFLLWIASQRWRWSGWMDALSFKVEAFLKANLQPLRSENRIPSHIIPTAVCSIISQKGDV